MATRPSKTPSKAQANLRTAANNRTPTSDKRPFSPKANKSDKGARIIRTRMPYNSIPINSNISGSTNISEPDNAELPITWSSLSLHQIQELDNAELEDLPRLLASYFQLAQWQNDQDLPRLTASYHQSAQWQTDLYQHIQLSNKLGLYLFAKDNQFNFAQIGALFSIMGTIIEKCNSDNSIGSIISEFRRLLINHCSNIDDEWDIFSLTECKLILDFTFKSFFQHFKLYKFFYSNQQECVTTSIEKEISIANIFQPLSESITLEAYEIEQGKIVSDDVNESTDEIDEKPENPFEILDQDEIKQISVDLIAGLYSNIHAEFDKLLEEQKSKFMNLLQKTIGS